MTLSNYLIEIMNEYENNRKTVLKNNDHANFIRREADNVIPEKTFNRDQYKIKASAGSGNWASVPWLAIFDKEITTSALNGL